MVSVTGGQATPWRWEGGWDRRDALRARGRPGSCQSRPPADRVTDADPQEVHGAAGGPIAGRLAGSGIVGGADHRGDRAFERAEDVDHPDLLRRASQLVAAMRRRGCSPRGRRRGGSSPAARGTAGADPRRWRSRRGWPGPAPNRRPSWTIRRTPYSPLVLNETAPLPWNGVRAATGVVGMAATSGSPAERSCARGRSSIPSDFVGISVGGPSRERQRGEPRPGRPPCPRRNACSKPGRC